MEQLFYCRQWFRHDHVPTEMLSLEQARAAYDSRTLYTVLVDDPERPRCFIESNMDYIGVEFLDCYLRSHACYSFQEMKPGMLFLSMAVSRHFVSDDDVVRSGTSYIYEITGQVVVEHERFDEWSLKRNEHVVDVSANWEPYPKFGEYSSIARLERGLCFGE